MRSVWLAWVPLVLAVGALPLLLQPPAPRPATAPPEVFSADRAARHLTWIAQEPHPWRSEANERVRRALVAAYGGLGLEAEERGHQPEGGLPIFNVVARLPGTASTGTILVAGHHDSAQGPSRGAADDGAAVAASLEMLRALRTGAPLRNDVLVLMTDGEEAGLLGARAFMAEDERAQEVRAVLNFEARGSSGLSLMFETHADAAPWVARWASVVDRPASNSLMVAVYRRMPNDTDFTPFRRGGLPGLNFAFIGTPRHYHTAGDTPDALSRRSLQHHGDQMLALVRDLGMRDWKRDPIPAGQGVHFDLLTRGVVRYPVWLAKVLAVLSLLTVLACTRRGGRGDDVRLPMALLRVLRCHLWALAMAAGVAWLLLQLWGDAMSRPVLATPGDDAQFLGLFLGALALALAALQRMTLRGALLAVAWWLGIGTAALAVLEPGGTFLPQLPLLAVMVALGRRHAGAAPRPGVAVLLLLPTVVVAFPLLWLFMLGLALPLAWVVMALAVPLFLACLAVLQAEGAVLPRRAPWILGALALLTTAAGFLLPA